MPGLHPNRSACHRHPRILEVGAMTALQITKGGRAGAINSRNGTADEAIERLFGKQAPEEPEEIARWEHFCNSSSGKSCYECNRDFKSGEPIYRARKAVLVGRGVFRHYSISMLSFCHECRPYICYDEGQCEICRQTVFYPWDRVERRHIFCSDDCNKQYWARYQREKRLTEREVTCQKVCQSCDRGFSASRSDTKFCSPACKQKHYRQRRLEPREGGQASEVAI